MSRTLFVECFALQEKLFNHFIAEHTRMVARMVASGLE